MFLSQPDKPCTGACRPPYVTGRSYPPFAPPDGVSVRAASRPFSASFARPRASVFLKKGAKRHAAPDTNAFYYNTIKSKDCQVFLRSFYKKIFSAQEPSCNAVRRVPCLFCAQSSRRLPKGRCPSAGISDRFFRWRSHTVRQTREGRIDCFESPADASLLDFSDGLCYAKSKRFLLLKIGRTSNDNGEESPLGAIRVKRDHARKNL